MSSRSNTWMHRPEKGSPFAIRLMAWVSFTFGRTLTRPVIYLIALFYLAFATSARSSSNQYLTRTLGRSPSILDQFKHFLYFATVTHDRLYLLSGRFDLFQFSISGEKLLSDALSDGKGLMLYGAHYGSFEAARYSSKRKPDLKLSMLMYEENGRKLLELLKSISPDFASSIISLGSVSSMLEVKDRLNLGHMIGLLADRTVNDEMGASITFLGFPANFPIAPFKLQRLFECPAFFLSGMYLGGNRYHICFNDLMNGCSSLTTSQLQANYVQQLERICKAYPYNWFNFYNFWDGHEAS